MDWKLIILLLVIAADVTQAGLERVLGAKKEVQEKLNAADQLDGTVHIEQEGDQTGERRLREESRDHAMGNEFKNKIKSTADNSKQRGCGRKRSICNVEASSLRIQPESFEIKGGEALFKVYEHGVPGVLYDMKISIYGSDMASTKAYLENVKETVKSTFTTPEPMSKGMAAYGAIFSMIGSINYFKKGEKTRGGYSLAMSIDNIGQLTGLNTFARRLADKVVLYSTEQTIKEASGILRTVEKTTTLAKLSPLIGIVFNGYFIAEDIVKLKNNKDPSMTALYATELALDEISLDLSIACLAFPVLEPVALAVSFARMGIDDVYKDIKEELDRVKGGSAWEKFEAFIRGYYFGVFDFATAGMGRQMRQLSKKEKYYPELFTNLSHVDSYFHLSTSADGLTDLDFAHGFMSSYGGFITVHLYDNSTFKVRVGNVANSTGQVTKEGVFHASNVTNIILGVGQSVNMIRHGYEDAKLWMLFTVHSYHTFDVTGDDSSLIGRYYGNKDNNNFISIEGHYQRGDTSDECAYTPLDEDSEKLQVRLQRYYYELYGKRGSDSFHIGPESSFLNGGEDADTYMFQRYSGSAIIHNFAADQIEDLIHLNVSHHAVQCSREGRHLNITYCRTSIQVLNWYSTSKSYQHLTIATNDGFELKPFDLGFNDDWTHNVVCMPIAIDKSSAVGPQIVDLRISAMNHVSRVVGSNYSDRFYGNDKANYMIGGQGDDYMAGRNGEDMYVIREDEGMDIIDTKSDDNKTDTIMFLIPYSRIVVTQSRSTDIEMYDKDGRNSRIKLLHLDTSDTPTHDVLITSSDHVLFKIGIHSQSGEIAKKPFLLDFSNSTQGISVNLYQTDSEGALNISTEDADDIVTIKDSRFNDTLVGNRKSNFLSCSGGEDYLEGRENSDQYIIDHGCEVARIFNFDENNRTDLLVVKRPFEYIIILPDSSDDLKMSIHGTSIVIVNWFISQSYQHLILKTSDGITAILPPTKEAAVGITSPIALEVSVHNEDCMEQGRRSIVLDGIWSNVNKFKATSHRCNYRVTGNDENNYIDPGPGNEASYQRLEGKNGSDTYIINYGYGLFNEIDNFAEDNRQDILKFGTHFENFHTIVRDDDLILTGKDKNGTIEARILDFFQGEQYQHLVVESSDGVRALLHGDGYPYFTVFSIDSSHYPHSQHVDAQDGPLRESVVIIGSESHSNIIYGSNSTKEINGGEQNDILLGKAPNIFIRGHGGDDTVNGGNGGCLVSGGSGDDDLHCGEGNDVFYGGDGADLINGSQGSDTVVFSGDGYLRIGVIVNLTEGKGYGADAEGDQYIDIENIVGSEYSDTLVGTDGDNTIEGFNGDDIIIPMNGNDVLDGGLGNDTYVLDNAEGNKKIILRCESDHDFDTVVLPSNMTVDGAVANTCIFTFDDDLILKNSELEIAFNNWNRCSVNFDSKNGSSVKSSQEMDGIPDFDWLVPTLLRFFLYRPLQFLNATENEISLAINEDVLNRDGANETDLIISCYNGKDNTLINREITPSGNLSFSNLQPGMEYIFTLEIQKCGKSLYSSSSISQRTLPSPPSNVSANETSLCEISFTWTSEDQNSGNYNYEVMLTKMNSNFSSTSSRVIHSSQKRVHIYDVNEGTEYRVSVVSVIDDMRSQTSQELTFRTNISCSNRTICNTLSVELMERYRFSNVEKTSNGTLIGQCRPGYETNEGRTSVLFHCTASELVPQSEPRCHPVGSCDFPGIPQDATVTNITPVVNNEIMIHPEVVKKFQNNENVSFSQLFTTEGRWREPRMITLRKGTVLNISCKDGFGREGPEQVICGDDLKWSPMPVCEVLYCPSNFPLEHGRIVNQQYLQQHIDESWVSHWTALLQPHRANNSLIGSANVRMFMTLIEIWSERMSQKMAYVYRPVKLNDRSILEEVELMCDQFYTFSHTIPEVSKERMMHESLKKNERTKVTVRCVNGEWMPESVSCRAVATKEIENENLFSVNGFLTPMAQVDHLAASTLVDHFVEHCDKDKNVEVLVTRIRFSCQRDFQLLNHDSKVKSEGMPQVFIRGIWESICVRSKGAAARICGQLGFGNYTASLFSSYPQSVAYSAELDYSHNYTLVKNDDKFSCRSFLRCRSTCPPIWHYSVNVVCTGSKEFPLEGEECSLRCNYGYVRAGPGLVRCMAHGWSADTSSVFCERKITRKLELKKGDKQTISCKVGQKIEKTYHSVTCKNTFFGALRRIFGKCSDCSNYACPCKTKRFNSIPCSYQTCWPENNYECNDYKVRMTVKWSCRN